MKQRGRKSAESKNIVEIGVATRPRAPDELLPSEKTLWNEIVGERPAEFFDAASVPLLVEYCRTKTQADQIAAPLSSFDPDWMKDDDGLNRYRNLVLLQEKAHKRLMALATKMRLTQQSRYERDSVKAKPQQFKGRKPWESD